MNKCVIMRGVPGSGKTTKIKQFYPDALVVSADHFFEKDGTYNFDAKLLGEAHKRCLRNFMYALERLEPLIVVDNTNTTAIEIAPYYQTASACDYEVLILTLNVPTDVAAKRCIHGVPEKKVQEMQYRILRENQYFPKWWNHKEII